MFKFQRDRYKYSFYALCLAAGVSIAEKNGGTFFLVFLIIGFGLFLASLDN